MGLELDPKMQKMMSSILLLYKNSWQKISNDSCLWNRNKYTHYQIEATLISNIFETGQNLRKIKQSRGVFFKKIEKISNNLSNNEKL